MTLLQRIKLTFTAKRYQGPKCCPACGEHTERGPGMCLGDSWRAHENPWAWLRTGK